MKIQTVPKKKKNLQNVKHIHSTESNSILQGEALIVVNKHWKPLWFFFVKYWLHENSVMYS